MSRILVIDDDVHIGNILEELLTREGHAVSRAYSGTEALLLSGAADYVTKPLLLERVSADTPDCTEHFIKTHMSNLRKKLRDAGAGGPIKAVWGIGFRAGTGS